MRARSFVIALITTVCAAACGSEPSTPAAKPASSTAPAWSIKVEPLALPVAMRSNEPQMTVSSHGVLLSWVEQGDKTAALKFAERTASGWSEATQVASGSNWFLSYADMPTVMRMRDGTLVSNWYLSTNPIAEGYDILLAYSKDEGKTWSRPQKPHRDKTKTQHGFVSMFEPPSGGLGLVWLDARDQENNTTDPEGGSIGLYAASFDPSWKPIGETMINARVCECCSTAAAVTDEGVITAFRDRSEKEIRDIAVTRLENGKWSDAKTVHDDNWEVDSCPVNGPAISARGRQVAVAWFNAKDNKGRSFAAFSSDAGRTWSAPIALEDQMSRGYVDVELLDDGSAVASWVEFEGGRSQFKVRRIEPSGARSSSITIANGEGGVIGYPRVARSGDELVFAWTEGKDEEAQQVKGAFARVR